VLMPFSEEGMVQRVRHSKRFALGCAALLAVGVLVRSGQEPVVVNLDIPVVEKPEEVHWVDNIHPDPRKR